MYRITIFCLFFISCLINYGLTAPLTRKFADPGPCDPANCRLPSCFCSGTEIPLGLSRDDIPQMVLLTFDDIVDAANFEDFEDIFSNRYNPNGAPISATYFVSHEYSDYYLIRKLYESGHEIGLHSISHAETGLPSNAENETLWRQEIEDHRILMSHFSKIPMEDIKGFRAPFLQMGGDTMFKVLKDTGLQFDYSRSSVEYLWPYTADYESNQECSLPPCHSKSYPGLWIVPTVNFHSRTGLPCAMVDGCIPVPDDAEETFDLLIQNFLGHYNGNSAPIAVPLHSGWLTHSGHKEGYRRFLDYLGTFSNVYILGVSQMLDWMKNPVTLDRVGELVSWNPNLNSRKRQRSPTIDDCSEMHKCSYEPDETPLGYELNFVSCQPCPRRYPWLGNPFGEGIEETKISLAPQGRLTEAEGVRKTKPTGTEAVLSEHNPNSGQVSAIKSGNISDISETTIGKKATAPEPIATTIVQQTTTHLLPAKPITSLIPKPEHELVVEKIPLLLATDLTAVAAISNEISMSTNTVRTGEREDILPQWKDWNQWAEDDDQAITYGQWVDDTNLWKYDHKQSLGQLGAWDEGPGQWVDDTKNPQYKSQY